MPRPASPIFAAITAAKSILPGRAGDSSLDGAERSFCCAGCRAVAQTIRAAGLESFYARRTSVAERPVAESEWSQQAIAAEAAGLIVKVGPDQQEISLLLEGIRCGACVWIIEKYLQRLPGVVERRCQFCDPTSEGSLDARNDASLPHCCGPSPISAIARYPYDPRRREALARRQGRALLSRMAIAVLAMMQVMMFAFPVYVSRDGVEPEYRTLLGLGQPRIDPARRAVLRPRHFSMVPGATCDRGRLGMDTPIALGIATAFVASAWATLVGRRHRLFRLGHDVRRFAAGRALVRTARAATGRRRHRGGRPRVAADRGAVARISGQRRRSRRWRPRILWQAMWFALRPRPSCLPMARYLRAVPASKKRLLTGESWPQAKACGDKVLAGSINRESPLIVRVTAAGASTALAALSRLVDRAASQRPRIGRLADSVAGWFVGVLLVVAVGTALFWWQVDASRAVMITFAVLVVSCPCALSLATPSVLAAAAGALGRRQILVVRADAIEALSRVTHVVLDKTGTLTTGRWNSPPSRPSERKMQHSVCRWRRRSSRGLFTRWPRRCAPRRPPRRLRPTLSRSPVVAWKESLPVGGTAADVPTGSCRSTPVACRPRPNTSRPRTLRWHWRTTVAGSPG